MDDPEKMIVKITYDIRESQNRFNQNIPDGTQYFSEPPRSHHRMIVGPRREVLHISCGKLLCKFIPKLYEALLEHNHDNPSMFQNDDPIAVQYLVYWTAGSFELPEHRTMMVPAEAMLKTFVFAERYGYEDFFNSHLMVFLHNAYRELCKGFVLADEALIRYVYGETRTGSPIRRMIVDSYVWDPSWDNIDTETCVSYATLDCLSEGEGVPVFEKDMQDSFRQRGSERDRGIQQHPFCRSEEEVRERYKYTVVPTGAWTTEAVLRETVANQDQQAGSSGFNLVMR